MSPIRTFPHIGIAGGMASATALLLAACSTSPQNLEQKVPLAGVECAELATKFIVPGTRITGAEAIPAGTTVPGMAQPYPMPAHC